MFFPKIKIGLKTLKNVVNCIILKNIKEGGFLYEKTAKIFGYFGFGIAV